MIKSSLLACGLILTSFLANGSGYDVRCFGAKGDGVTDDTEAIRRAVAALEKERPKSRMCVRRYKVCHREAPFAAIVFPKGTYRVTEPIVINGDAMLVGEDGATVVNASAEKEGFFVRDAHNLIVRGLTFVGGLCQIRLWTRNRDNSYLHVADCAFRDCRGTSLYSVSYKESGKKPSVPIETAYGEVRGIPFNNSTLMIVERCHFENNATALRLYSDGLTVRNCAFVAPPAAADPQLNVGSCGHMGVEMYFRDLTINYPSGSNGRTAAVLYQGGRGVFENVRISASDDLTAFRSLAKFNDYHKPSCLDLRNVRLATGVAPVLSMAEDEFPNRISVYGLTSEGAVRQRLLVFDREPTRDSIDRGCADASRLMREPPEQCLAIMIKNVDERHFDCALPTVLRQYVCAAKPDDWKRPYDRASGSTFGTGLPTGRVFSGASLERMLDEARAAGGGTVVLPAAWLEVEKPLEIPDNTRVTCVGRAALWMKDENAPIFRVADGNSCVFENLLLIDGLHAVEAAGDRGRVRLLDCSLLGQKGASIFARGAKPAGRVIEMTGSQSFTPYLYRGNATFTVDGFWYEESTERDKGENRPSYASMVNEPGGEVYFRDFLGVPCYFQNTPKEEAYVFGKHTERRGEFRWIDNYGTFVSVNTRYGGEWGGLTPVFHFGKAVTWIEGGNIEIGNVYLKNERSVVVADTKRPDVTVVDAASGHHIEPFQVFFRKGVGDYEVADARLSGNYPFLPLVPVWPKGRAEDREDEYEFRASFDWNGKDPVRFDLEASCIATVWLNGEYVGNGPRPFASAYSRQARFDLVPRPGRNELVVRTKRGAPGFFLARIVEGNHVIARTAVQGGDFDCGLPLEERVKPPRSAKDIMPKIARPETDRWQDEIDRAASSGGGVVSIPKGVHPVGQLNLKSNVELHLEDGAVLEGVYGLEHYGQLTLPCSEGTWSAVVLAYGATNVAITGRGTINGRGDRWSTSIPCPEGVCKEGLRPRGLFFGDCRNIRLEDFTLRDAACWGVVFKRCEDVVARRVRIDSHANHNNDGFDVEARNVLIADCDVDSGDDAICIKSNDPDFTVENVLVTNCVARSHCNGLKLGTASHGTMRHIRFCDCRTANPRRNFKLRGGADNGKMAYASRATDEFPLGIGTGAINIENVDGGVVEDIVFDGIEAMGFSVPIFVRGGRRMSRTCGIPRGRHSRLADLTIRNVKGESCRPHPCTITGVASCPVRGIRLENVRIVCRGTDPAPVAEPGPEYEGAYPDASMFFKLRLPAYGLYADFVEGLRMDNVDFVLRAGDSDDRPPVFASKRCCDDVPCETPDYDLAAFVWPAYQPEPRWSELGIFDAGIGEWQNVSEARKRFDDDLSDARPLWGFEDESDPDVVERKIDVALQYGINVFIYDWYWYGGRPFLANALEKGFLGARNNTKMRFFVMWANHNVTRLWNNRIGKAHKKDVVWTADVSDEDFRKMVEIWIGYFKRPNYYRIDGKPVFCIYLESRFLQRGVAVAEVRIDYLRRQACLAGLPGVHLMLNGCPKSELKFDSMTMYNWGFGGAGVRIESTVEPPLDYDTFTEIALSCMDRDRDHAKRRGISYFPNLTIGWDNNSRFPVSETNNIVHGMSPESFERGARRVREWFDRNRQVGCPPLITVNSWNEWTEGSYLEPSDRFGFGFLEAVRRVFVRGRE